MKKILFCTWICALAALMGCQQDSELTTPADGTATGGRKVTVTANIQGGAHSRVALTPGTDDNQQPIVKVEWEESGEKIYLYPVGTATATASSDDTSGGSTDGGAEGGSSVQPIEFTQVEGTNRFEGTLPDGYTGAYEAVYGEGDLTVQHGTLDEAYVLMEATGITDLTQPIEFEHRTAILKPTFKVDGTDVNASITQIVMDGIEDLTTAGDIIVTPSALSDIYIFLPVYEDYEAGHKFSFSVIVNNEDYEATLTIPDEKSIEAGKLYTADITLTKAIPYLTFKAAEEQELYVAPYCSVTVKGLEYSVGGAEWKGLNTDVYEEYTIPFGGEKGDLRLRGKSDFGTANEYGGVLYCYKIKFSKNTPVACTGDIRTLIDWEKYADADLETGNARFSYLFSDCTVLTSAPDLPATELAEDCYKQMFSGCTSLTAAPALPAKTLAGYCYYQMFSDCTSLTTAPALPATTLATYCYRNMFSGCTSLTVAPALPAKTLAMYCYSEMFFGCTSLTTAPALPAEILAEGCYNSMFQGCSKLSSITMLATNISATDCLSNWVEGVAASGIFTKAAGVEIKTGIRGIPEGWTVKEEQGSVADGTGDNILFD